MRNRRGGTWATRLKQARERHGWSQENLANRANVSRWTVMRWERGDQEGKPGHLRAVAEALDIDPAEAFIAIGWLPEPHDEKSERSSEQHSEITDMQAELDDLNERFRRLVDHSDGDVRHSE